MKRKQISNNVINNLSDASVANYNARLISPKHFYFYCFCDFMFIYFVVVAVVIVVAVTVCVCAFNCVSIVPPLFF